MKFDKIILAITLLISLTTSCPDDPYCYGCVPGRSQCELCQRSFTNSKTKKCDTNVPRVIEHCLEYRNQPPNGDCIQCFPGYGLINKTCVECTTKNCYLCDEDQVCYVCAHGMKLIVDKENPQNNRCSEEVKCSISNCEVCANDKDFDKEQCYECKPGFVTVDDRCIPTSIENCVRSRLDDDSICVMCRLGFYVASDGSCKVSPQESRESMRTNLVGWSLLVALSAVVYFAYTRI